MKKIECVLLALMMVLALTACGGTGASSAETSAPETDGNAAVDQSVAETDGSAVQEIETAGSAEAGPSVELVQDEGQYLADDGAVLMEWSCQTPVVSIPDNSAAEALIQADLDLLVSDFQDWVTSQTQSASELYESSEEWVLNYYDDLTITVARCDGQVISLVVDEVGYAGGAHGWDNRYTRNYDVSTGERITFETLGGEDFVSFCRQNLLSQMNELEQSEESPFFDGYEDYIDDVLQDGTEVTEYGVLEPTFYFNEEGVVFIDGEYVLQPYAGGILEFTVLYADLAGIMADVYFQ